MSARYSAWGNDPRHRNLLAWTPLGRQSRGAPAQS
jgi:hypothetical protein